MASPKCPSHRSPRWRRILAALAWSCACLVATSTRAQPTRPPIPGEGPSRDAGQELIESDPATSSARAAEQRARVEPEAEVKPYGSQLFGTNFANQRADGLNPDYQVMPGDRVAVNAWGALQINEVFIVDGQGNIFLPEIGPVHVAGVKNADLTATVKQSIRRVYLRNFDVYTNLLNASPVAIYVTGGVRRPGRYSGLPSDSVLHFLEQAGGIDADLGSYRNVEVHRGGEEVAHIDLYEFLGRGHMPTVQLEDGDTLFVGRRGPTIALEGDVATPYLVEGKRAPFTGAEALDVVPMRPTATEATIEGSRDGRTYAITVSIQEFRETRLYDGDVVSIRVPTRQETILVHLEGEFEGPSVLSVKRGTRLLEALNYVPVDGALANTDAIHLKRASVAASQKKAIDDSLFRLERMALLTLSQSNGEADIRVKEAELMSQFIERARLIQPLGRVVTARADSQLNVLLEDGDIVVIPRKTNVIQVGGEVQMTQAVLYEEGLTAGDYVDMAGGYSDRGDEDRILVMHANAAVTVAGPDATVRPGDQVLVTPKMDPKRLQNTMDVIQVVYQIAVAAGVAIAPVLSALN